MTEENSSRMPDEYNEKHAVAMMKLLNLYVFDPVIFIEINGVLELRSISHASKRTAFWCSIKWQLSSFVSAILLNFFTFQALICV